MVAMTKPEFARQWDSDDCGGGITYDDIADCAQGWGLYQTPRNCTIHEVRRDVVATFGARDVPDLFDEGDD